jgi:hypothetical protein
VGSGEYYIMMSLVICTPYPVLFGDKIEKNAMAGACNTYGEKRGVCWGFVGKHEGTRSLGRPRLRWEDNIKMGLQKVRCGGMDWIDVAQTEIGGGLL